MALPGLPQLPSLSERPQINRKTPAALFGGPPFGAPDWGFGGGGYDLPGIDWSGGGGYGGYDNPFGGFGVFGGGSGIGGGGGSGSAGSGVTVGSVAGTMAKSALGIGGLLPAINWGRIAAFLLGLLLIGVGLYLIKPINQAVRVSVNTAKRTAQTVGEAVAE